MAIAVRLYLKWLVANAIGQGVALGLILESIPGNLFPAPRLFYELAYDVYRHSPSLSSHLELVIDIAGGLIWGVLMGGAVGGAQYMAMRGEIAPGRKWIAATAAAGALALLPAVVGAVVFYLMHMPVLAGALGGGILGGVMGVAQAIVLKDKIRSVWAWPVVTAVAMTLGLIVGGSIAHSRLPLVAPLLPFRMIVAVVCGTVYGGLTGWFLTWARLRPAPGQPTPSSPLPAEAPSEMP